MSTDPVGRAEHDLIVALAHDASVAAGVEQVARRIAAKAAASDSLGRYRVDPVEIAISGLSRRAYSVVNSAPGAATREFGRSGTRPLGRAAQSVRGA